MCSAQFEYEYGELTRTTIFILFPFPGAPEKALKRNQDLLPPLHHHHHRPEKILLSRFPQGRRRRPNSIFWRHFVVDYIAFSMKTLPGHESSSVYKTTASTFPSPLIFFGHNIPRTINHHHHYHPKQPSSPHFTRTNTTFSSAKTNYICNFTSHTQSHIPWNRIPSVEFTELISILNGFKIPQNPLLHFLLCHPD